MKISVLSPVFNEEQHIHEMMGSLRAQIHPDWEVCFVDDGSTDNTVDLIQAAAEADPRFRLIAHGRKLGKSRAFNLAFEASDGDVIALLAGDDRLPPDSLIMRDEDLEPFGREGVALASYKLRSFSEDPAFDGMVLPRGDGTSMSGGSLTMTRALAEIVFPIPETLPSEDLWIGFSAPVLAHTHVKNPRVCLDYRIHPGNSNPRNRPFETMTKAIAPRHEVWARLLEQDRFPLPDAERDHLSALYAAELQRRRGNTLGVLRQRGLSIPERASLAAMSHPTLWQLRNRFYKVLSGRQGR